MKVNIIRGTAINTEDPARCTGRTLGIAYQSIGMAMTMPNVQVNFTDHHDSRGARESLLMAIRDIIKHDGLRGFTVGTGTMTLVYNPIVTLEEVCRGYKS